MMMTKQCQFKQHSFALPDISPQPDLILPENISLRSEPYTHNAMMLVVVMLTIWVKLTGDNIVRQRLQQRRRDCDHSVKKIFKWKIFPPHNFHFAGRPHCNHSSFPWIPRPKGDDCYLIDKDFSDMTYCYVGGLGVTRSL